MPTAMATWSKITSDPYIKELSKEKSLTFFYPKGTDITLQSSDRTSIDL